MVQWLRILEFYGSPMVERRNPLSYVVLCPPHTYAYGHIDTDTIWGEISYFLSTLQKRKKAEEIQVT